MPGICGGLRTLRRRTPRGRQTLESRSSYRQTNPASHRIVGRPEAAETRISTSAARGAKLCLSRYISCSCQRNRQERESKTPPIDKELFEGSSFGAGPFETGCANHHSFGPHPGRGGQEDRSLYGTDCAIVLIQTSKEGTKDLKANHTSVKGGKKSKTHSLTVSNFLGSKKDEFCKNFEVKFWKFEKQILP